MLTVNISQAKSSLSKLVSDVEQGTEREIIVTRNGKPVARLVPLMDQPLSKRLGAAKGRFEVAVSIDAHNDEISRLFSDEDGASKPQRES